MHPQSKVSYAWNSPECHLPFSTGVSLHSHTSLSRETLSFLRDMGSSLPLVDPVIRFYDRRARARHHVSFDFHAAHWCPPLVPRMAFELEYNQIRRLGLAPLVSITDHDDIQAPLLLRTLPQSRPIPVSVEWTVPFGPAEFHLGLHNLPSRDALAWIARLHAFTASPRNQNQDRALDHLLAELHALPDVLIVFNHPIWDLQAIGPARHTTELHRFLARYNSHLHAFELNGLRHARENRAVIALAGRWNQLLLSGGDRHGLEPNANINLTNAPTFTAFVHEIRTDRRSNILFLDQYRRPWEQRLLESTIEAISDHPNFAPGWQRWDERAFHPDRDGVFRPLAEFWTNGRPPLPFSLAVASIRLLGMRPLRRLLSLAVPSTHCELTVPDAPRKPA